MGGIDKLKIESLDGKKKFEAQINPASFNVSKGITYTGDNTAGTGAAVQKFNRYKAETLSFDFTLDATGVAYELAESIKDTVTKFEQVVYRMNPDKHSPSVLNVVWGTFCFRCRIKTLKYDYTLFSVQGDAVRVKITASFEGYTDRKTELKQSGKQSPDLSRLIVLREGDSIHDLCRQLYGDPSFCEDVARYNGLSGFRNIKPGTTLMFPPLTHNGQFTG